LRSVQRQQIELRTADSIVWVRQKARQLAVDIGLGLVDQTKLVTATSELARNTLDHGRGGTAILEVVENETKGRGLRLTFLDEGPGIPNVELALSDGYSTGGGLGMGLGGARRLVSEFYIESEAGKGTQVTIVKWK
jgi:serine/threonine-protein kinase RsbT